MQKMLGGLTAAQYLQQVRLENLTLLHHVAFSGNIEALNAMSELPYFKEVLDESENEVGFRLFMMLARVDAADVGCHQEAHDCREAPSGERSDFAET